MPKKHYSNSPASTLLSIVKTYSEINYLNHELESRPSKKHTNLAAIG